jgi:hypothetical protein
LGIASNGRAGGGILANANKSRIKNQVSFSVRCSEYELAKLREAAKRERRSLSAYVLNAAISRVEIQERIEQFHPAGVRRDS